MADPRGPLRVQQRLFWRLIREGDSLAEAAAMAGGSTTSGWRWFRKAGGMPPLSLVPPVTGRLLCLQEREQIAEGLVAGLSLRAIGMRIGREPSTVSREVKLNMRHRRSRRVGYEGRLVGIDWIDDWQYLPSRAQRRAEASRARPKPTKLAQCPRLRAEVQERLENNESPEQIAARLLIDFPDDLEMRLSHETIYVSLFVQGRGELRRDLHKRLRTGRALRKPRRNVGGRRGRIPGMVNISERPAEVEDRAVPGHWEGDLIMGSIASNSAIGTLVERATRYVMLLHLPNGHGADAVQEAMVTAMAQLPATLRRTLTWDQGKEMTNHAAIAAATDLDIYFCDPASPWQRGSNENTNGLLRQYFPKGADLSLFPADYLAHVERQLNSRPRKTLSWRKPTEALDELLSNPPTPPSVATTA
jgi:transposase, IS30 family